MVAVLLPTTFGICFSACVEQLKEITFSSLFQSIFLPLIFITVETELDGKYSRKHQVSKEFLLPVSSSFVTVKRALLPLLSPVFPHHVRHLYSFVNNTTSLGV